MLYAESQLKHCHLSAKDGELGRIEELYFDDKDWKVRYLVADVGGLLSGRRVLLPPDLAGEPDVKGGALPIRLTRDQIRSSPETDFDRPLDETHQQDLALHYGWPGYWGPGFASATPYSFMPLYPLMFEGQAAAAEANAKASTLEGAFADHEAPSRGNPHLHGTQGFYHCGLATSDGEEFGRIHDFLIDYPGWELRYFVADLGHWFTGKQVLISPAWINQADWHSCRVHLKITRPQVEAAPPYHRDRGVTRQDEVELFEHFAQAGQ